MFSKMRYFTKGLNVFRQSSLINIPQIRSFSGPSKPAASTNDIVIPQLVDTLEWVVESPPNVHQFDEPPIIVEIEHLENLVRHDH